MKWIPLIFLCAFIFGICYGVDKLFTKIFRSRSQHQSGKSVRLSKHYGSFGLILTVLGIVMLASSKQGIFLAIAGVVLPVVGIGMIVYYMSFGVYYDESGFLLTTFGKRSKDYNYGDIVGQQLYEVTGHHVIIELYLVDGRSVQLQSNMTGVYEFMDRAFAAWLEQTGRRQEDCSFDDPENSCWFPAVGE